MAYLMGIDIGSTSIKAVIYDETGTPVSQGGRPTVLSHIDSAHPAWAVWEPEIIWDAVCGAVRQALDSVDSNAVTGVAVTGFGMDGLPVNSDGTPLYPLISWHCPRTNEIAQEFSRNYGQKKIFEIAGTQLMPIHTIYRMMWMRKNHPGILEKTEKWLLIEDYINFKLCGIMATDYSMAWNTSVLDQKEGRWSDKLIEAAGVPKLIFPEIKQSGTVLGNVCEQAAQETGLSKKTSVVLGGHDIYVRHSRQGHTTITSLWILQAHGRWCCRHRQSCCMTISYSIAGITLRTMSRKTNSVLLLLLYAAI
jgi:sugar (pentulose or hexulose) kinase